MILFLIWRSRKRGKFTVGPPKDSIVGVYKKTTDEKIVGVLKICCEPKSDKITEDQTQLCTGVISEAQTCP